ncbi:MAG: hypothetical protein AAF108_09430 [Planctomycetota bacterium]
MSTQTRTGGVIASAAALLALAGPSAAQGLDVGDFAVQIDSSEGSPKIMTGLNTPDGTQSFPVRVNSGELGTYYAGFWNIGGDPGFESQSGVFEGQAGIGLDILGAARVWDGSDFDAIEPVALVISQGAGLAFTPSVSDEFVPGPVIAAANSIGKFHSHPDYSFEDVFTNQTPRVGVWLLPLRVWTTQEGVAPSDPIYIVLHQLADGAEVDAALEWTQANRVDPCPDRDLDGSGSVDMFDLLDYLGSYFDPANPTLTADVDRDLDNDTDDLAGFVLALESSCDP